LTHIKKFHLEKLMVCGFITMFYILLDTIKRNYLFTFTLTHNKSNFGCFFFFIKPTFTYYTALILKPLYQKICHVSSKNLKRVKIPNQFQTTMKSILCSTTYIESQIKTIFTSHKGKWKSILYGICIAQ
jgi:late competence protein required for DNA uptake (superfamily II DNA/RNA helicase)